MGFVVRIEIACYTVVRSGIGTVWRNVHLDDGVVLHIIILTCGHTHARIGRQHDDTCMVGTHTDLIFRTDHTKGIFTTQFAFLDSKGLISVIEHGSDSSHNDFLSGSYVRCSTNDRQRFSLTDIHFGDMQVVGIRVGFTTQHFSHYKTFQTTFDGFYGLHCTHFQTDRSKNFCYCLSVVCQRNVAF